MDGAIFDIKRFAIHDGPGIRTTVFLQGCPLNCKWCHNPESIRVGKASERYIDDAGIENKKLEPMTISITELESIILKDRQYFEESSGGVTFSGGEPTLQHKFLITILDRMKVHGIHSTVDTCGCCEENRFKEIAEHADLFLYDLKLIDSKQHKLYTDVENSVILKNLEYLVSENKGVIIRHPFIPDVGGVFNFMSMLNYLKQIGFNGKIDILPYHDLGTHKKDKMGITDTQKFKKPTKSELNNIKALGEEAGFTISIGGTE